MIYIILFTGLFITGLLDLTTHFKAKQKYLLFWFWIIIFILLKGLRWDTGTDWAQYYTCFEKSNWNNIFSYYRYGHGTTLMEFGYVFLNALVRTLFGHYTFFLLITNALILIMYGKVIYNFIPKYQLATLAIAMVSIELFPVRQTLTFSILCYALNYIIKKEFWKYLLCILICFTIHRISLVYIIFYFIFNIKFNYKRNILIYLSIIFLSELFYAAFDIMKGSLIIQLATGGLLNTYDATSETMKNMTEETNNTIVYLSSILQLSLYSYCYHIIKDENIKLHFNLALNMYFICLCLNNIGLIPGFDSIFRLSNALAISYPLCIGFSFYSILKKPQLPTILIVGLFTATFYIKLKTQLIMHPESPDYKIVMPYKSFLQQDEYNRTGKW